MHQETPATYKTCSPVYLYDPFAATCPFALLYVVYLDVVNGILYNVQKMYFYFT